MVFSDHITKKLKEKEIAMARLFLIENRRKSYEDDSSYLLHIRKSIDMQKAVDELRILVRKIASEKSTLRSKSLRSMHQKTQRDIQTLLSKIEKLQTSNNSR